MKHVAKIIPIASGKGGVGKSIVALNLALSLALQGKTVVLADFDLGGATQHLLLGMGIKGNETGLGNLLYGKERRLENLVMPTDYRRLHFISGDAMLPGTHNIAQSFKNRIAGELRGLVADYVILDLGAGSSYTVVDFFLTSYAGIVVVNPEVTSVMAAYSFMKTVLFRALYRIYPVNSTERGMILKFVRERIEGLNLSFSHLIDKLIVYNKSAGETVWKEVSKLNFKIVFNMMKDKNDREWGGKLTHIVKKKLGCGIEIIGAAPYSAAVGRSVSERIPLMVKNSDDAFGKAISELAREVSSERSRAKWLDGFKLRDDDEQTMLRPGSYL